MINSRNAAILEKKRKEELVNLRRLQQFSISHLAGPHLPLGGPPLRAPPIKEEIKDQDSGCESPQEDVMLKVSCTDFTYNQYVTYSIAKQYTKLSQSILKQTVFVFPKI